MGNTTTRPVERYDLSTVPKAVFGFRNVDDKYDSETPMTCSDLSMYNSKYRLLAHTTLKNANSSDSIDQIEEDILKDTKENFNEDFDMGKKESNRGVLGSVFRTYKNEIHTNNGTNSDTKQALRDVKDRTPGYNNDKLEVLAMFDLCNRAKDVTGNCHAAVDQVTWNHNDGNTTASKINIMPGGFICKPMVQTLQAPEDWGATGNSTTGN